MINLFLNQCTKVMPYNDENQQYMNKKQLNSSTQNNIEILYDPNSFTLNNIEQIAPSEGKDNNHILNSIYIECDKFIKRQTKPGDDVKFNTLLQSYVVLYSEKYNLEKFTSTPELLMKPQEVELYLEKLKKNQSFFSSIFKSKTEKKLENLINAFITTNQDDKQKNENTRLIAKILVSFFNNKNNLETSLDEFMKSLYVIINDKKNILNEQQKDKFFYFIIENFNFAFIQSETIHYQLILAKILGIKPNYYLYYKENLYKDDVFLSQNIKAFNDVYKDKAQYEEYLKYIEHSQNKNNTDINDLNSQLNQVQEQKDRLIKRLEILTNNQETLAKILPFNKPLYNKIPSLIKRLEDSQGAQLNQEQERAKKLSEEQILLIFRKLIEETTNINFDEQFFSEYRTRIEEFKRINDNLEQESKKNMMNSQWQEYINSLHNSLIGNCKLLFYLYNKYQSDINKEMNQITNSQQNIEIKINNIKNNLQQQKDKEKNNEVKYNKSKKYQKELDDINKDLKYLKEIYKNNYASEELFKQSKLVQLYQKQIAKNINFDTEKVKNIISDKIKNLSQYVSLINKPKEQKIEVKSKESDGKNLSKLIIPASAAYIIINALKTKNQS